MTTINLWLQKLIYKISNLIEKKFLLKRVQIALVLVLVLVYTRGLFVPIMNNNAAHHANIALHMYLTGDYLNLIDRGQDYLDKPHLLFWLAALSYHIFGVTSFAYKFFSFVFALIGVYATGQLGRWVGGDRAGRYAALIMGSAFAFGLSLNDVRMDAMVVSCIAFATWQLLVFWCKGRKKALVLSALGLALGFATKGMVAVALPVLTVVFYALQQKRLKDLFNGRWLLLILLTMVFLSPVFYCFYLQFDLHPEKVVRGQAGNSGIGFLLWGQSVQRYTGSGWGYRASDPFYLVHTFLWAFAPWSILAFLALGNSIRSWFRKKRMEGSGKVFPFAITTLLVFLLVSFSRFKNDHYINILFPYFSVLTSHFLVRLPTRYYKAVYRLQYVLCALLLLLVGLINAWAFPVTSLWTAVAAILIIAVFLFVSFRGNLLSRTIWMSFAAMVFCFFLLNHNFYPKLLTYQSGHVLAQKIKEAGIDPNRVYYLNTADRNYSLDFSLAALPKSLTIEDLKKRTDMICLFTDRLKMDTLQSAGVPFHIVFQVKHYNVTTLRLSFLNPSTRSQRLMPHYLLKMN